MYKLTYDHDYKSNIIFHSQLDYNSDVFIFDFDTQSKSIYCAGDYYVGNNFRGSVFLSKITNRGFTFYLYIQAKKVSFFIPHSKITVYES
jgi:hypothetical protein